MAARAQHLARRLEGRPQQLRAQRGERGEEREPLGLEAALPRVVGPAHHVVGVEHLAQLAPHALAHSPLSGGSKRTGLCGGRRRLLDLSLGSSRSATPWAKSANAPLPFGRVSAGW